MSLKEESIRQSIPSIAHFLSKERDELTRELQVDDFNYRFHMHDLDIEKKNMVIKDRFNIAILTVIPKEFEATSFVFNFNKNKEPFKIINGLRFWKSTLKQRINNKKSLTILHSMIGSAGNVLSSLVTTTILHNFKIDLIILCGIAAGNKNKVSIYSPIVCNDVIDYEHQKLIFERRVQFRLVAHPVDQIRERDIPHLVQRKESWKKAFLKNLDKFNKRTKFFNRNDFNKKFWISKQWKDKLTIEEGVVASGEKLLADEKTFNKLIRLINQRKGVLAGEMEGSGFCTACHENKHSDWLIIRGISDYGGREKSDFVNDKYQIIAALSAATLVHDYLINVYIPTITDF